MLEIVGIGDNVVDRYIDLGVMFPGGNAVNVPILSKRLGARAAYIGVLGTDQAGDLLKSAMEQEGLDLSHLKVMEGENGYARVQLVDGERVFLPGGAGVSDQISFTPEDLEYIKSFNLIHSSVYSFLEHLLPTMAATGVPISYDYSDCFDWDYIDKTIPHIQYAFFSGGDRPLEEIKDFMKKVMDKGVAYVLVTRGKEGSIYYDGKGFVEQSIIPAKTVDTMGAGDSFIAGFLYHLYNGQGVQESMKEAAAYAAYNCGFKGTFGYETKIL